MDTSSAANSAHAPTNDAYPSRTAIFAFVDELGHELSKGTLSLPSFPDAVVRIQQVLADHNATVDKVALVVQSDPAFTAKLFRMANSVILKRGDEPLSDLKSIINRIGYDTIRNLAVALATRQMMSAKKHVAAMPDLRRLWEHSVDTAALAYVLARDCSRVAPNDALLAGILHDIGSFYILSRMDDHPELFADRGALDEIISNWHSGIGRVILEDWRFPSAVIEAVDEHEDLRRDHRSNQPDLADVVLVANLLSKWNADPARNLELDGIPAVARLHLNAESARDKITHAREDLDSIKVALS